MSNCWRGDYTRGMAIVLTKRSPWWILVFLTVAAALAAGVVGVGWKNSGKPPEVNTLLSIVGVCAGLSAALTLPGALGARATFVCGTLGLMIGLFQMLSVAFTGSHDGMADLAAVLSFLMFGVIGAVVGALIDLLLWAARRRRG